MNKLSVLSLIAGATLVSAFTLPAATTGASFAGRVSFLGDLPAGDAGKVVFDGEKPEAKPLSIPEDKAKGCAKEGEKMDTVDPSLVIDAKGGLANVVVLVTVKDAALKVPEAPVDLDQHTCHFTPHVTIVPVGSKVEFKNSDGVSHNVHTYPAKNDPFNQTIAAGSKETIKVDKEDKIEVKCDIHPWMNSWIIVANTNFYAVTAADGSFKIDGLPAGEHDVTYWHEKLGKQTGKLKVGADGKIEPVEIKMGAKKEGARKR
jgi:plastocyanin